MNKFKSVLVALLQNTAFALVSGAFIYLLDKPMPGFSRMGSALLMSGIVFVAMPINIMGIVLLDEYLTKRSARHSA